MSQAKKPLIFDVGSFSFKAGFAGDDDDKMPSLIMPSIVGQSNMPGSDNCFFGREALSKQSILDFNQPIKYDGVTIDWDAMELIWSHVYHQLLRVQPYQHSILWTEPVDNSKTNRENVTQLAFETFDCPSMNICPQSLASLYASGRTSGVVLDSGHAVTNAVPIYEGQINHHAVLRLALGGGDVTKWFHQQFRLAGHFITHSDWWLLIPDLKKKLCYVALDFDQEMATASTSTGLEKNCKLPDGELVNVNSERFRAPEMMFQPSLIGRESMGVDKMIDYAIVRCPPSIQNLLYSNVLLAGGNTMFPGFADRLKKRFDPINLWINER